MAKPTAIGAYIFAGGQTLGMERHLKILAHFEDGPYGVSTFRAARPKIPVYENIDSWPWDEYDPDVIYSNPPCAAWSPLGPRIQQGPDAWKTDARVDCARADFNLLELMQPKIWTWESVPSAFSKGRPLVDWFTRRAHAMGYDVSYVLMNAMYVGAMQQRRRFFFVAHRIECPIEPRFDEPVMAAECLRRFAERHPAAARWATDDGGPGYVHPINQPAWVIKGLGPGQSLRGYQDDHIEKIRAKKVPRSSFAVRRAHPDKPMPATTGYDTIHPTEPRFLSLAEMLFSTGYPIDYPLQGNFGGRGSLIARGVLPSVADWLGKSLARAVKKDVPTVGGRTFEVNYFAPPGAVKELS